MILDSDFDTLSSAMVATGLKVPVQAGRGYTVLYNGRSQCNNVTGLKLEFRCPAGSSLEGWLISSSANSALANWFGLDTVADVASGALHAGASDVARSDRMTGGIIVGAAGFVELYAGSVTNGARTRIKALTSLILVPSDLV